MEILGASTVLLYGTNLVLSPVPPSPPPVDEATGLPAVGEAYHVRVVVPCYKESLVSGERKGEGERERAAVTLPFPLSLSTHPHSAHPLPPLPTLTQDIVRRTILAAREAALPTGCSRTVYLLDDGRDPKKRKWVDALADPAIVYVSGRKRPAGEMNGERGSEWERGSFREVPAQHAAQI